MALAATILRRSALFSAIAIGIDNRLRARPATRALGAGLGRVWNRFCLWLARDVEDEFPL